MENKAGRLHQLVDDTLPALLQVGFLAHHLEYFIVTQNSHLHPDFAKTHSNHDTDGN
jgi:hypothetical protein